MRLNFFIKTKKYFIVKKENIKDKKIDNKFKIEKFKPSELAKFLIP